MPLSRRHFCGLLTATSALGFCGGCAVNPATGKQDLILVGAGQEKSIGLREHPKILSQFGGAYDDRRVAGYVASIGGRLAAATETPGLGFTFTLLNSPVVNAFALPGGYVYITRGLMALAQDEAELAGVLGHEIGHVV
ncbi:MAG: M48 family metalloprotease, partial [Alphaproteobacteria bacterium]|nr:M48 family metalloprotease [Alphaproteobacteria bacterium]